MAKFKLITIVYLIQGSMLVLEALEDVPPINMEAKNDGFA